VVYYIILCCPINKYSEYIIIVYFAILFIAVMLMFKENNTSLSKDEDKCDRNVVTVNAHPIVY